MRLVLSPSDAFFRPLSRNHLSSSGIGGHAVKGSTTKMMRELGIEPSATAVAHRYADLLDGYIVDHVDAESCAGLGLRIVPAKVLMETLEEREKLARLVLETADRIDTAA
jgi:LPPG:FO 2-phospho-L-lactate transferase